MIPPDVFFVANRIEQAGRTLMCLPNVGKPSGYRSGWPDYLYEIEKMDDGIWKDRPQKIPRPSPLLIKEMDEVLANWIPMLIQVQDRKILLMRMLIRPLDDSHVYSWRKIGRRLHMEHRTAKANCERAILELSYRLQSAGMLSSI